MKKIKMHFPLPDVDKHDQTSGRMLDLDVAHGQKFVLGGDGRRCLCPWEVGELGR